MTVTRFQQKRGTSAQWAAWIEPLRDGEFGIDKDTGVVKIGDGFTLWADLDPIMGSEYLPILGKANDSYRLDGLASTDFLRSDGKAVDADKLDGNDSAFYMPASAASSFLSATGKAVDSDKLDGLDSTAFLPLDGKAADSAMLDGIDSTGFALAGDVGQTSPTRKLTTYWGSKTSFPTGVLSGDICLRSDVGTNGSHWTYFGPGKGASGWIHKGKVICTAAARPASALLYDGLEIYETDTKAYGYYDANASKWRMFDTIWQTYTPSLPSGMIVGTGGNPFNAGMYMRRGQEVSLRTGFIFGTTGFSGGTGAFQVGLPAGLSIALPTGLGAMELEFFMKSFNTLGNAVGFAYPNAAGTALTPYGITSGSSSGVAPLASNSPSTGWAAGHNFFIAGSYPIA